MTISTAPFDARQLRDVFGTFVTGVTVVTTRDAAGVAQGVTANSFNTVSLEPPLVLWSQALTAKSFAPFRDSPRFTVNILADDQIGISNNFARSREDKFEGIPHHNGLGNVPILDGVAAYLECVQVAAYPSGDHMLYIGRVERMAQGNRRPLAFSAGRYMVAHSCDLEASYYQANALEPVPLSAIRRVSAALPAVAEQLGGHTLCLSVWGNHGPTAVHWEPSSQPVSDQLFSGLVMPVTRSATGLAFAAFLPEAVTQAFIEEDLRQSSVPGEDLASRRQRFTEALAEVREQGLARMVGTTPSLLHKVPVHTFSAPIVAPDGGMLMALTLAASATRLDADWHGQLPGALLAAADTLSAQLQA
ncbi:MAG: flavin reductase [Pseudomonas sp.]|uniref:flavin reductase n=1 Tax=Pseudomonas sp. TaxID=306 RepID=UPI0030F2F4B4